MYLFNKELVSVDEFGRCNTGSQTRVSFLNSALNVLGVVVGASHNDQILRPSADEQLATMQKSKIARFQIPFSTQCSAHLGSRQGQGLELLRSEGCISVVALRLGGRVYPYLAHEILGKGLVRV